MQGQDQKEKAQDNVEIKMPEENQSLKIKKIGGPWDI
jgi:hypothetical protein